MRSFHAVALALIGTLAAVAEPAGKSRARIQEPLSQRVESPQWNGREGPAVLRAQVLLSRARFSPGEIDGASGKNFERALKGYQKDKGLPVTGTLDEPTWSSLNTDAGPILQTYTITPEDAAGPFQNIPADMMEKAKLKALGFRDLAEALGERFHVSPSLLRRLNPGIQFSAGEQILVPDPGPSPHGSAARVVITREGVLQALDASGALLAQFPCSSGSEHDPLPIGDWKILKVLKNPPFFYNPKLFWDAKPGHSRARIAPGPNNPVGVVWVDLSKEHYGIHGTPEPSSVGHAQSHGCIRLTNWDAAALADMVSKETAVLIRDVQAQ